jgi:hypothetical protein
VFDRLPREAEGAAKTADGEPLEPLEGGVWHAYCRDRAEKWADERASH